MLPLPSAGVHVIQSSFVVVAHVAQFVPSVPVQPPVPSKHCAVLDAHVVQFVPPAHAWHPGYAVFAAAHFFAGSKHGVLVPVSHCVHWLLESHGLPALQPVDG